MQLSQIGEFAKKCWMKIPDHLPCFYLDAFVVMPNHVHGIVLIEKPYIDNRRGSNAVETRRALSLQQPNSTTLQRLELEPKPPHFRFRNQGKNTISAMVGSFKSAVTKLCNENKLPFGWQSRFHDHVIRDKKEFYRIRNYIINNPANWKKDLFIRKTGRFCRNSRY
ncbi:MAG TPA: hypothetical protein VFH08_18575 [Chitinophagaceae bacterium]|nr:hypothetical protein [Chitinophagaceae bacterium]